MAAKFGTFEELVANADTAVAEIAHTLRHIVLEIHPETVEVVRLGDKAASYGVGPKKMSEAYCYIMPLTDRVNLGFYHGTAVSDPHNLLEGSGKRLRHVKVNTVAEAQQTAVADLIRAALAERQAALAS